MELFTALSEVNRATSQQFNDSPTPDQDPRQDRPRRPARQVVLRQQLSHALRALARAIEPPRPATGLEH